MNKLSYSVVVVSARSEHPNVSSALIAAHYRTDWILVAVTYSGAQTPFLDTRPPTDYKKKLLIY